MNTLRIAVHPEKNSFSANWIRFFKRRGVAYKLVDCCQSDILAQLDDCQGLMWHWHHWDPRAVQFARALSFALEAAGKKMFPNATAAWHFDDKVAQKYLLESLGLPMIPTWVFYSKNQAVRWLETAEFPLVFKLRRGSGSINVFLLRTRNEALRAVKKSFGRGYSVVNRAAFLQDKVRHFRKRRSFVNLKTMLRGIGRLLVPWPIERILGPERGYAYFQKFLPGNDFDVRVVVIGGRAFALRRFVRENDFRASGSGNIDYNQEAIDKRCIMTSQKASKLTGMQCCSYDYIFNGRGEPLIVEMSYGFPVGSFLDDCPGYWTESLEWVQGPFDAQAFMAEDFLESLVNSRIREKGRSKASEFAELRIPSPC